MDNDDLRRLYELVTSLRQRKVKMKDMADRVGMASSVFSAIYSTVLPAYLKNVDKGMAHDEALDNALIWVNNVSKNRLLGSISAMIEILSEMDVPVWDDYRSDKGMSVIAELRRAMNASVRLASDYCGTYMSYSVSSSSKAMKVEPYLIAPSSDGTYIEVGHGSAYGCEHWGVTLMNGLSHVYLSFNENHLPQLSLFNICLKLPMYDHPPFLRGIYTCFDYNYNPIARRILFVKQSDSTDRAAFRSLKGCLKKVSELTDEEKVYYRYTCENEDVLRMCNIPFPSMTLSDLDEEKEMLRKLSE